MQKLYESGAVTWKDDDSISACTDELQKMLPGVSNIYKLRAAVDLRLRRLDALRQIFNLTDTQAALYSILISRAVELGGEVVGVIPMFDMIDHLVDLNLAMSFDGDNFELLALRDIKEGEDLFLCYNDENELSRWDEDNSVWTLVQWGGPQFSPAVESLKVAAVDRATTSTQY